MTTYRKVCTAAISTISRWPANIQRITACSSSLRRHISVSHAHKKNLLYTAVCVERCPVITAEKNELEQEWADLMAALEMENSLFSDHEVRHKKDMAAGKKKKKRDDDLDSKESETALDVEDRWDAEYKNFVAASRVTEADERLDTKSVDRCLDSSLYLLVKQKIEGRDHWVFPQAAWEDGETLRQTAERTLESVCGNLETSFTSRAPCAVAKFGNIDPEKAEKVKIFFYKSLYKAGNVTPNEEIASDYLWVTSQDLHKYCYKPYLRNIRKFIQ